MKNVDGSYWIAGVLSGLLVSAIFVLVVPWGAVAQSLDAAVGNARTTLVGPFITIVSYISYGIGTVMTIAGIAGAKKHADNPGQNPLGPVLGRLGAGIAFLAAPTVVGLMQGTGEGIMGGARSYMKSIGF